MSAPAFAHDRPTSDFVGELLRLVRAAPAASACPETTSRASSAAPDLRASSAPSLAAGAELPAPSVPAPSAEQEVRARDRRKQRRDLATPIGEQSPGADGAWSDARASVARPLLSSDGRRAPTTRRSLLAREESDYLLDVHEAAAMLNIAPTTLRNWAYQRRIPRVKLSGLRGPLRFRRSDVQRLIRASLQGPLGARLAPREVA